MPTRPRKVTTWRRSSQLTSAPVAPPRATLKDARTACQSALPPKETSGRWRAKNPPSSLKVSSKSFGVASSVSREYSQRAPTLWR